MTLNHGFSRDLAVVGAGHIGLPWAATMAADGGRTVTCVDIDEAHVERINEGTSPFSEPKLGSLLESATGTGRLRATTDESVVADHKYVALTTNARRNHMAGFLDIVGAYANYLSDDHVLVSRTTVPVGVVPSVAAEAAEHAEGDPAFVVFPERLAEGRAVAEIRTLPKIVGTDSESGERVMRELLSGLDGPIVATDPRTAMFVKLIDNTYRDGLFAIANQIAYVADQIGLDAHTAVKFANFEYPRNDIPTPGTVGGKCLPKDPHFLMDETICEQPTTPDLFAATRRTNASLQSYVTTEVLKKQPTEVAVLGVTYKADVADRYNAPATAIGNALAEKGVRVREHDPHVDTVADDLPAALADADVVVLGVPHAVYEGIESVVNQRAPADAEVYDIWGFLDPDALDQAYDGFGINDPDAE